MRRIGLTIATALVPLLASGCNAFRLDPPAGFAQVSHHDYGAHMKANNNVGLKVSVFENYKGGTLDFWARDMVEKLGRRGYELTAQSPARSKNGVAGTRFDFRYTPMGQGEAPRFYTAVLFVSDEHRVVLQLAGREEYKAQYVGEIDQIAGDLKVRGCRVVTRVCKGPQPERLSTPAPASTTTGSTTNDTTDDAAAKSGAGDSAPAEASTDPDRAAEPSAGGSAETEAAGSAEKKPAKGSG